MKKLESLKKGDIVDIVFPANTPKLKNISNITNFIKSIGLEPRIFKESQLTKTDKDGYIICSNEQKLDQLYKALSAKDSKLVWCWAGGYGSGELIAQMRKKRKIHQNKIFIGYSDETFLTTFLTQEWGWKVLCAPMINDLVTPHKKSDKAKKDLLDFLFGNKTNINLKLKLFNNIELIEDIEATVTGGCLSILLASFGTKNQIECKNKILFLEDTNEIGFRLTRKFIQIADFIIDNKQKPKAILLGNFETANTKEDTDKFFVKTIENFAEKLRKANINIPILQTKNFGHTKDMTPLMIGAKAKIKRKTKQIFFVQEN